MKGTFKGRVAVNINIPNILSVFRILLIPVFVIVYMLAEDQTWFYAAAAILLLSGITDMLDGIIARKFNMITQVGKILDPAADKLTQVAVLVCLTARHIELIFLLALFFIKELLMLIGGVKVLRQNKKIDGARWYGKIATVVFYIIMLYIVATPGLSRLPTAILISVATVFMIFAFIMYVPQFFRLLREKE